MPQRTKIPPHFIGLKANFSPRIEKTHTNRKQNKRFSFRKISVIKKCRKWGSCRSVGKLKSGLGPAALRKPCGKGDLKLQNTKVQKLE